MDSKKYIQVEGNSGLVRDRETGAILNANTTEIQKARLKKNKEKQREQEIHCLLYTSPSPRDKTPSRMPSSA